MYLPSYSPQVNPIEQLFSKMKSDLNVIRPRAISRETLIQNLISVIDNLIYSNFDNYYRSLWVEINEYINNIIDE